MHAQSSPCASGRPRAHCLARTPTAPIRRPSFAAEFSTPRASTYQGYCLHVNGIVILYYYSRGETSRTGASANSPATFVWRSGSRLPSSRRLRHANSDLVAAQCHRTGRSSFGSEIDYHLSKNPLPPLKGAADIDFAGLPSAAVDQTTRCVCIAINALGSKNR